MFGKDGEFGGIFEEEYEMSEEEKKNYKEFLKTFHTLPITEFTTNFLFDPEFGVFRGSFECLQVFMSVYKFCTKTTYWFVFLLFWLPCFILRRLLRGYVNVDLGKFFRGLGKGSAVFRHFENMSKHRKSIFFWLAVFYVMFSRFSVLGFFYKKSRLSVFL